MSYQRRVRGGVVGMIAGAAAAASLAVLGGCDRTPDVVRIGVAQPLSGNLSAMGHDLLNGTQMAVDEINAAGGVTMHGRHVRLQVVSQDDKANVEGGDAAAHALVAQDVVAAIADFNSGVSIHAAPIYAAAHVAQLSISTKPEFTHLGLPTTFRLVASDTLLSKAVATYAMQLPGATHFAVVDDNTPYGKGLADSVTHAIAAAGKSVDVRQSLDDKTTDFGPLVAALAASKIDVVASTLNDFQVDALIDQLARAGLRNIALIGSATLKTDRLLRRSILPIRAVYTASAIAEPNEFPGGPVFLEKFRRLYKADPVYAAHYAYDAVYMVADALARDESVDREALVRTLKTFDGNCPMTGAMRFGADGEQRYGAVAVYQWHDGGWDPLMRSDRW